MCVALSVSTEFTCLHTPAQRHYSIIRSDVWIATFHRLARYASRYPRPTDGTHVCTFDSSDCQAYYPHAGSAGFAYIGFGEPRNFGRYLRELYPHHFLADGSWVTSRAPCARLEEEATRDTVYFGGRYDGRASKYSLSRFGSIISDSDRLCRVARILAQRRC